MSEELLITRLHEDNSLAFKEIFKLYYHPLCMYAYRYVQDDAITDDFVQDAFLNFWERRGEFHALTAIRSFLYLSVRNACLNWLKHLAVRQRNEMDFASFLQEEPEDDFILEDTVHAKLYVAIEELSDRARVIVLMTLKGASNPEIASTLGVSLNTVKTVKLRAYRVLREKLKDFNWLLAMLLIP